MNAWMKEVVVHLPQLPFSIQGKTRICGGPFIDEEVVHHLQRVEVTPEPGGATLYTDFEANIDHLIHRE